jgi:two-component system cell cycle response regulator
MSKQTPSEVRTQVGGLSASAQSAGAAEARRFVVLLVEDSELQAFVLQRLLEKHGYEVAVASNGREGLAYLQSHKVDLVLSDVNMPEMNGYELCVAIRNDAALRRLPIILLTSLSEGRDILLGLKSQADYYLTKPYDERFLLQHVSEMLNRPPAAPDDQDRPSEVAVVMDGQTHLLSAGPRRMLTLLLSTYECAVQQNRNLVKTQRELGRRNEQLQAQTARLAISERNFRNLLEHNADGMAVVDAKGLVLYGNPAAHTLLAKPGAELVGQPFEFALSEARTQEVQILRPGRDLVIAELQVVDTVWEGKTAWLASLRDITQRKHDEQRILEQQAKLAEANARLEALATTDGLTGLANHRTFKEKLQEECQRAQRFRQPLALAMLDVDHFKPFNDAFGHPAGDEVLQRVARLLGENIRQIDVAARYGGEEFTVLLPNTGPTEAILVAERLRHAVEVAPWSLRPVTVSLGVAYLDSSSLSPADLIRLADQALYRSKQNGRNRVTPATAWSEPA